MLRTLLDNLQLKSSTVQKFSIVEFQKQQLEGRSLEKYHKLYKKHHRLQFNIGPGTTESAVELNSTLGNKG